MYQKEIIYLSFMSCDIKEKNVGFCKIEQKQETYHMDLQIQKLENHNGTFQVRVQTTEGWKEIGQIMVASGRGSFVASMKEAVCQIEVLITKEHKIVGQSKRKVLQEPVLHAAVQQMPEKGEPEASTLEKESRKSEDNTLEKESRKSENISKGHISGDKWEQLLTTYEKIHPYGDERIYIKLEPKDFVILRANYQHLVNNSFLLHGFYNYRYLILGKEKDFYLGVPGVFYEREKMVALMFGFEAFECEGGAAEEGRFGYYLRKVEL